MNAEIKERVAAINSGIIPEGYKKTKVGIVPVEWDIKALGKISQFLDNQRKPVKENERSSGIYPYYGASGIIDYVDDYLFDGEYILLGEDGANIVMRSSPLAFKVKGKMWINNHAHVISPNDNCNIDFLVNILESLNYEKYNSGTAQPKLNREVCESITLPFPPLPEQQKIAEILSTQDKLIELQEKKIEQLKELKKAYLQKMFPQKGSKYPELRFKGFTEPWEQRKVSEITEFHKQGFYTTEAYDESKKYYLLRGTDLTDNRLVLKGTPKIDATEKDYQAFKTQIGDFLIVRSGTVGTYGIVYDDIPAIFGSYLIDFRFDKSLVVNEFFGYFYQSDLFKNQLRQIIQQSANTNINAENIKSTSIKLPSLSEQNKIANFFTQLDSLITLHQRKSEQEKQKKKALMQLLLTGIVRTK